MVLSIAQQALSSSVRTAQRRRAKLKPKRQFSLPAERDIYFIQSVKLRLIKIGIANDVDERIRTIQVGSADRVKLLCAVRLSIAAECERELHAAYAAHHVHGEWFKPVPALLAEIEQAKAMFNQADQEELRRAARRLEPPSPPRKKSAPPAA